MEFTRRTQHLEIVCSKHDLTIYVKLCFESATLLDVAYTQHIHWSVYKKALDIICNLSLLLLQSRDATFRSHIGIDDANRFFDFCITDPQEFSLAINGLAIPLLRGNVDYQRKKV